MRISRRQFVAGAAALPWAARAMALDAAPQHVLLGTGKGKGIYRASWDAATGTLGAPELAVETVRPTYFARHPSQPVLYVANEAAKGAGTVSSFRMGGNAELTPMGVMSAYGSGTCYVSADETRVYAADYGSGGLAAYEARSNGTLVDSLLSFDCNASPGDCGGLGPVATRQNQPHLHCAVIAPGGQHVIACDLGDDTLLVFERPGKGVVAPIRYKAQSGSGPRHVAFHPAGQWVYCIHELNCTLTLWDWSVRGRKGVLKQRASGEVRLLPPGVPLVPLAGNQTACEVLVSDDGKFVYANVRGIDQVMVYAIGTTGLLTEVQRVSSHGTLTRLLAFDPSRRWLLGMNQGSDTVTVFAHDAATGKLGAGRTFAADSPMCVAWI